MPEEYVPYSRFNDGACDIRGRYFGGTLWSKKHDVPGQLYRYDPKDGSCVVADPGPFTVGATHTWVFRH
jgi:sugar lactone lactonase YvrE